MNRRAIRTTAAVALVAAALATRADEPGARQERCRAELVAATTSVRPGGDVAVGVKFALAPGVHVYWKNPGESGMTPTVEWTLPAGFAAGPLQWPAPRRIDASGITCYGYDHEVLLFADVKAPADAKPGDVRIDAHVKWLACDDQSCVPGEAKLELTLPVKDAAPAADPRNVDDFARARRRLPRALPAGAARIDASAEHVTLTVDAPELAGDDVRAVAFFPAEQLVLDDSVKAVLESKDVARLRIRLEPAQRRTEIVKRLQGVLVATTKKGASAFEIDATTDSHETAIPGGAPK